MTLGAALREGMDGLRAATDAPRLEAEVLLAHVTGLPRAALLAHPDRPLGSGQRARYQALVRRRAAGYPLPYLTGRVEFYGLEFAVSPAVLIPRAETETLVDLALARRPQRVVDVGTGSGCLAVALAVHLPTAHVIATDLSAPALRVAAANVRRHGVEERIRLIRCDLTAPLVGPFDLVIANPPYVARWEWPRLPASVRRYEPRLALDGGSDGLEVLRRLLAAAPRLLGAGGTLLVEIGAGQGAAAAELARAAWPAARVTIHPDLAGRPRVLEATR